MAKNKKRIPTVTPSDCRHKYIFWAFAWFWILYHNFLLKKIYWYPVKPSIHIWLFIFLGQPTQSLKQCVCQWNSRLSTFYRTPMIKFNRQFLDYGKSMSCRTFTLYLSCVPAHLRFAAMYGAMSNIMSCRTFFAWFAWYPVFPETYWLP